MLEGCLWEKVNGLRLLVGQGEETDLLQVLDCHVLEQVAQLVTGIHSSSWASALGSVSSAILALDAAAKPSQKLGALAFEGP